MGPGNPYNAANTDATPLGVAQAAVGQRATLPLTGTIIEAGVSPAGTFVKFAVDGRWGFGA